MIIISIDHVFLSIVRADSLNVNSHGRENNSYLYEGYLSLEDTSENLNVQFHRERLGSLGQKCLDKIKWILEWLAKSDVQNHWKIHWKFKNNWKVGIIGKLLSKIKWLEPERKFIFPYR